jgi:hypothetical protein
LGKLRTTSPSHEWLGYFQVQRRNAENGNRDGRAPHYGRVALSAIRNSQFEMVRASFSGIHFKMDELNDSAEA